jgi:hypothetical protein
MPEPTPPPAPPAHRQAVPGPVLVMGTGSIGGWVGGRLAAAGVPVVLWWPARACGPRCRPMG